MADLADLPAEETEFDPLGKSTGGAVTIPPPSGPATGGQPALPSLPQIDIGSFDEVGRQLGRLGAKTQEVSTQLGESARTKRQLANDILKAPLPQPPTLRDPTPPPDPAGRIREPLEAFGGAATLFAAIGGLLTRRPLTTALKAGAAAITAYRQNDLDTFYREFDNWKAQSDYVKELNDYSWKRYSAAMDMHSKDQDAKVAAMRAIAAADNDTVMQHTLMKGDVDMALRILNDRRQLGQQMFDNQMRLADMVERNRHNVANEQKQAIGTGAAAVRFSNWLRARTAELGRAPTPQEQDAKWKEIFADQNAGRSAAAANAQSEEEFIKKWLVVAEQNKGEALTPQEELRETLEARREWSIKLTGQREQIEAKKQIAADTEAGKMARASLAAELREKGILINKELTEARIRQSEWWRQTKADLDRAKIDEREQDRILREAIAKLKLEHGEKLEEGRNRRADQADETRKEIAAGNQAVRLHGMELSAGVKANKEAAKAATKLDDFDNALTVVGELEKMLEDDKKRRVSVTGMQGVVRRAGETVGSALGMTDETPAHQFRAKLQTLRIKAANLMSKTGKSAKDERQRLDQIVSGIEYGDTTPSSLNNLRDLRDLLQRERDNVAIDAAPRSSFGATGESEQPPKPPGAPADARIAPDGNWYVPDPARPGKFLMWTPD